MKFEDPLWRFNRLWTSDEASITNVMAPQPVSYADIERQRSTSPMDGYIKLALDGLFQQMLAQAAAEHAQGKEIYWDMREAKFAWSESEQQMVFTIPCQVLTPVDPGEVSVDKADQDG